MALENNVEVCICLCFVLLCFHKRDESESSTCKKRETDSNKHKQDLLEKVEKKFLFGAIQLIRQKAKTEQFGNCEPMATQAHGSHVTGFRRSCQRLCASQWSSWVFMVVRMWLYGEFIPLRETPGDLKKFV